MISVIVQTLNNAATLPIVEDAGAKRAASVEAAVASAKADWLLLLPATLRLEAGWDAEAAAHLQNSGGRGARFRSDRWWPLRLGDQRALLVRKGRFGQPLGRGQRLNSK